MPSLGQPDTMNSSVFLRKVTIFGFLPASLLLIIHGVITSYAFPALGMIPQAGSAALGLLLLYRDRVAALGSPVRAFSSTNIFFADLILAVVFLAMLIPTFVLLGEPRHEGQIILGTYASVFMIINLYETSFSFLIK